MTLTLRIVAGQLALSSVGASNLTRPLAPGARDRDELTTISMPFLGSLAEATGLIAA